MFVFNFRWNRYLFIFSFIHSFIIYLCCLQVCQFSGLLRCFPKRAFYWRKFLLELFSHEFDRAPSYTIRRLALWQVCTNDHHTLHLLNIFPRSKNPEALWQVFLYPILGLNMWTFIKSGSTKKKEIYNFLSNLSISYAYLFPLPLDYHNDPQQLQRSC